MTDPDFEVVKRAWERGSAGGDDEVFFELLHEDIEVVPFGAAMQGVRYRGIQEVLRWRREEIDENWDYFHTIAEEFERIGDKLLVTGRWRARGKGSGVELERPATWIMQVREGKIAYWQTYTDRDEALRDLGREPG